jgi:hypothetical protein
MPWRTILLLPVLSNGSLGKRHLHCVVELPFTIEFERLIVFSTNKKFVLIPLCSSIRISSERSS